MPITFANLVSGAQELADFTSDDDFISAATWKVWINQGVKELHRLVVTAQPDSYLKTVDFTLTTTNSYALPSDFLFTRGLTLSPGQANRQTVHKYNFGDRDALALDTRAWGGYLPQRKYRTVSRKFLYIEPQENCAGNYRLYYIPAPTALVNDSDQMDVELAAWDEYPMIAAAIKAVAKEEGNTNDLLSRLQVLREDILVSADLDSNEPNTITDTNDAL